MTDTLAEHSVLGAVIVSPSVAGGALLMLEPDEFTAIKDRTLAAILGDMLRHEQAIDEATVRAEIMERGAYATDLTSSYLHTLTQACLDPRNAGSYAGYVRKAYRARRAQATAAGLTQELGYAIDSGETEHLDALLATGIGSLSAIPEPLEYSTADMPPTLQELMAVRPSFDWLVPNLLERGERLMITGVEGGGKTWLIRQIAACLAAGVHPFTAERFGAGLRVLHVDAENSVGQTRRGYVPIIRALDSLDPDPAWEKNLMVVNRADGLDLVGEDKAWWIRTCARASPDVLITGPIYRLHLGNPNAEEDVRKLIQSLDAPRVLHNSALILEAHAGHGAPGTKREMRPSGASMWRRWPENGIGLSRSQNDPGGKRMTRADVENWRMSREDRAWPDEIEHGSRTHNQLPWVPSWGGYDGSVGAYGGAA